MKKRITCALLSTCLAVSCLGTGLTAANAATETDSAVGANTSSEVSSNSYGLMDDIQDGTILHCFDWTYNDIKAELKNIAEAGFTAVQTSPAQANNNSGTWYWLYQPKGFYIGSNDLGTKSELQSLCTEAEKYGIKVVVDVVANHLEGDHSNIQDDLKDSQYWHTYGSVSDWSDRYQVTHGDIGMKDLATENSYVQSVVKGYINELKSVGVDGIRFDAAKHIGLPSEGDNFWSTVTSDRSLWYYGEILVGPDDRSTGNESLMVEYTNYITVTDSTYGMTLRNSFSSGSVPDSYGNWSARGFSSDKLIYWAESHDTWSNGSDWGYSWGISQNNIDRAYAVAASRNGTTALYFSRPSSSTKESIKAGQKGSTHFTSAEVAEVNKFHNAMNGKADYYTSSNGCAVITRKDGGTVIVKGSGSGYVSVENGGSYATPGTYTDQISGNTFTVTSTTISGTVGSSGIAVIYDAVKNPSASVTPGTSSYKTDTLTLTLSYANATAGYYSIDGGSYTSFSDGDTITIGSGLDYGTKTTVSVKASSDVGTSDPVTYTYTKKDPSEVQRVYFDNSSYNWSNVYAYIYNDTTSNTKWPGEKMSLDSSTGYYVLDVDDELSDGYVIFTESSSATTNRYPADQEQGLALEGTTKLFKANHVFVDYTPSSSTTASTATTAASPTSTTSSSGSGEGVLIGDVNVDGRISISDATETQKHIARMKTLTGNALTAADTTGDGSVNIKDVTAIQCYLVDLTSGAGNCGTYTGDATTPTTTTATSTTATKATSTTATTQATTASTTSSSSDTYTMTFTNSLSWSGTIYCYYWSDSSNPVSWPGTAMTYSYTNDYSQSVYTIEIPCSATYVIFTNGSSQTVDISITGSTKYYADGGTSNGKYTVKTWT